MRNKHKMQGQGKAREKTRGVFDIHERFFSSFNAEIAF